MAIKGLCGARPVIAASKGKMKGGSRLVNLNRREAELSDAEL
jgi:hypothetical protein